MVTNSLKFFIFLGFSLWISSSQFVDNKKQLKEVSSQWPDSTKLSLLDYHTLSKVKENINSSKFKTSYKALIDKAGEALNEGTFSVVQKSQTPPSGDKHDYISYGPYWWPDPDKPDGLPWIRRDGEINPLTREGSTDHETKGAMINNTTTLSWAYFFFK